MIKINENISIPPENPFQNDALKREIHANNLEKIIQHTNQDLVISIDAGWGKGKTTFIRMWKQKLDNSQEYQTLYFNAWENDDTDDPLISLMVDMEDEFPKPDQGKFDKVKEASKLIIKKAIPTALKIATHGILGSEHVNLGEFNEEQLESLAGELGTIELKNHKREKRGKQKFKEALKNYQQSLNKKIVFFIDELDRCRPTFAIETLEKIKHLFNIDGFIFVLSLDMSQLKHCVKQLYGQGIDSAGYLRRFIDLEYTLAEPDIGAYCDLLIESYKMKNRQTTPFFVPYLKGLIKYNKLSLRDINKLMYYLNLILPITDLYKINANLEVIYLQTLGIIYSVFPLLKFIEPDTYKKFITGNYDSTLDVSKIIPFDPIAFFKNIQYKGLNSNFSKIIKGLLNINLDVCHNTVKDEDRYLIGLGDEYSLVCLLDSTHTKLEFASILEFAESFNIPD